jgi:hypothetical protein
MKRLIAPFYQGCDLDQTTWILLLWALFCLLSPPHASAQTFRGGISGTVADSTGAVIPRANVGVEREGTGMKFSMETGASGTFSFADLPTGLYTAIISQPGFQAERITNVEVQVGRTTNLAVTLKVASATETATIDADTAMIETSQTALSAVVTERAVQEIPLNGRDFRELLQLTPGFNAYLSMNGNRTDQNNWQIDGADNNDFWLNRETINQVNSSGIPGVLLPLDSISEFNQQSLGGADFGRNPGSLIEVVTKSGTNDFHGSLYYFNRNEAFAEQSPFTPPGASDKLRNHQYGSSLGGPIWRDRLLFFLNYEGQHVVAGNIVLVTVPSAGWVADAEAIMLANNVPVNPVMVNLLHNLWPSSIRNAPATANNFCGCANNDSVTSNGVARVDYALTPNERLTVRGFAGSGDATGYFNSVYPAFFRANISRVQNWAAILNSTITSRLANQLLFGVNHYVGLFDDAVHDQDVVSLGFNTGVSSVNFGAPNIEINGFFGGGVGGTSNLGRQDTTWHLTDDLSYMFGRHMLRFGGELRRAKLSVQFLRDARGAFFFDGQVGPWYVPGTTPTAEDGLADFLAGSIDVENATIATGDPRRSWYVNSFSLFAQDNWQVSPRLSLALGLRYEYDGPLYDPTHTSSTFLPAAPGGLAFPPHVISSLYPPDRNNFAPRLGFAFAPIRGGKTVLRGAWGIYYDIPNGSLFIDNQAYPGGRGVARNPGGANPVFTVTNENPITVIAGQPIFGGSGPEPPYGVYGIDQNLRSSYVQNFSFNVQRQLTSNVMFQAGYVGSQGRKLIVTRNINQPPPSVTPYPELQAARPFFSQFPNFSGITQVSSAGDSQFNSFQLSMRATNWHRLTGQLAYTFGHARDDMSYARNGSPTDNNNLKGDYGNADFDTRHNLSGYVLYDLPQIGHAMPRLTNGWELTAFWSYNSGFPITVFSGLGDAGSGSHTGNRSDRADLVGDPFRGVVQPPQTPGGPRTIQWISPAAFAPNKAGTFGTSRRNQFYQPSFKTIDFSIIKNTPLTERVKVQFRAELFNVFNILNLGGADNSLGDPGFGTITSTAFASYGNPGLGPGEPFNVQFALKIIF